MSKVSVKLLLVMACTPFFSTSAILQLAPEVQNRIGTGLATAGTMFVGYTASAISREYNKKNVHAHWALMTAVHTGWAMGFMRSLRSLITTRPLGSRDALLVGTTLVANFIFPYIASKCRGAAKQTGFISSPNKVKNREVDDQSLPTTEPSRIGRILKSGLWGTALTTGILSNIALLYECLRK